MSEPEGTLPWRTEECQRVHAAILEFLQEVHAVVGLYWDAWLGFGQNVRWMSHAQASSKVPPGVSKDDLPFFVGKGDPSEGKAQHAVTQGEFKKRNARGGENEIRMSQVILVFLYETWEVGHRRKVADAMGSDGSDIQIPAFGDLRRLRNLIVHERGTLDEETLSRLEVLRVGRPGSRLSLDQDGMQAVLDAMKDGLLDWFATRYDLKDEPPSAASTT